MTNTIDKMYTYVKNLQGDIMAITDNTGAIVAEYKYDVYGKIESVKTASGTTISDVSNIGLLNPIRYRGYCYDNETGLYYLISRYYDPTTGRFINADDPAYIGATGTVLSHNIFVYCENNPVNNFDPTGHAVISLSAFAIISLVTLTVVAVWNILDLNKAIGDLLKAAGNAIKELLDDVISAINKAVTKAKGKPKTSKKEKHHIIAKKAKRAKEARTYWVDKCKFGINDEENLVYVNYNVHKHMHTNAYYDSINALVKKSYKKAGKNGVAKAVEVVKEILGSL